MPAEFESRSALSRTHPLVARIRRLARSPEERLRQETVLVEGVRASEEALAGTAHVQEAIASARLLRDERGRRLLARLEGAGIEVRRAGEELLGTLCDAEADQGVLLLVDRPRFSLQDFVARPDPQALVLLACGVQDPGNLGALVRLTDAAAGTGLIAASGADPFGPKAVRASAGSIFRLPVVRLAGETAGAEAAAALRLGGLSLAGAVARGGIEPARGSLSRPLALVVGGEAAGLPNDLERSLDQRITIPINPRVESLNVASAAAILLFAPGLAPGSRSGAG